MNDEFYTKPEIYEAVKNYAVSEYGLEGREIVRPFWKDGDYKNFNYPIGGVVIDNQHGREKGKCFRRRPCTTWQSGRQEEGRRRRI